MESTEDNKMSSTNSEHDVSEKVVEEKNMDTLEMSTLSEAKQTARDTDKASPFLDESNVNKTNVCVEMVEESKTNDVTVSNPMITTTEAIGTSDCGPKMEEKISGVEVVTNDEISTSNDESTVEALNKELNTPLETTELPIDDKFNKEVVLPSEIVSNTETVTEQQEVVNSIEELKETTSKTVQPMEGSEISSNTTDMRNNSPKSNENPEIISDISTTQVMDVSNIEAENNVTTENTAGVRQAEVNLETSNNILNENVSHKEMELKALLEAESINQNTQADQNIVPNSSLKLLAEYDSDSDQENNNLDADPEDNDVMEVPLDASTDYRNTIVEIKSESESEESSSDDSDIEYLAKIRKEIESTIDLADEDDEDDDDDTMSVGSRKKKHNQMRVKGELLLEDLPPIQDLHITVPEKECIELGRVHSIVDQLLLVSVLPDSMLLDIDTVLFLDKGQKVLGMVFDVLGQVADPMYCIRFNTHQEIEEKNIKVGDIVYVAPKTEYTQFIILSNLMKLRGSDASWENDIEPPPRFLDYSDDEQEREARARLRNKERPNDHQDPSKRARGDEDDAIPSTSSSVYSGVPKTRNIQHEGRFKQERGNISRQPPQHRQNYNQNRTNSESWHSNYRRPYNTGRQMQPAFNPNVMPPAYAMYPPFPGYGVQLPSRPAPAQSPMFVVNPLAVVPPAMFTRLPPPKRLPDSPPPPPPGLD